MDCHAVGRLALPRLGLLFAGLLSLATQVGCKRTPEIVLEEGDRIPTVGGGPIRGFYLLNEGNMGSNKATIDFVDYDEGLYRRNIYSARNPSVVMELGDVGNDIAVYGHRLYIVVNASGKVEVLDAGTARRIGQIDIMNCRSIAFDGSRAYVTSYAGPIDLNADAPQGVLHEVDTATLELGRACVVGYQPDGVAIAGGKAYVANSGGYRAPRYDRHISVVDLASMSVEREIDVGLNLNAVRQDREDNLWITSRGDYGAIPPRLHLLRAADGYAQAEEVPVPCTGFDFMGDSLLYYGASFSLGSGGLSVEYGIVSRSTRKVITSRLISDGTQGEIQTPYGIWVDAHSRQFYIADAKGYTSSGELFCYSANGVLQWRVRTGDLPGHFAPLPRW